ncbi:MAG: hypothetical protein C4520_00690 [Candidatus Abyssobacteria bacterium SURF_5]|uniref:Enoyl reductase (ER) domain-containing protein n=1 Tax=Abyssobacteria bacterium (strain SURF_5) TaxID=2093360 RepID=A0A3A4P0S4_ABYX5|nr:MAG: hypothetical protein C4520_00690 [Candidatus Abyssubacteria bacterium SURF_5]
MKAAILKNARELVVEDVPEPKIALDEVLVRIAACGICGTDLHLYKYGALNPNQKMGHESAGTIEQLGDGVDHFHAGDRVAVLGRVPCGRCHWCLRSRHHICPNRADLRGGFSEFIAAKQEMLAPIPGQMTFAEAACMEPMAVSVHGVRLAGITDRDGVVVTGAGPIGLFAAAYLRHLGVRGLVVSEPSAHRREVAAQWADRVVNPLDEDLADTARTVLNPGADVVVECSGQQAVLEEAFHLLNFAGKVLLLGTCLENVGFNPATMLVRELAFQASYGCDMQEVLDCIDLVGNGRIDIKPIISGTASIEELPDVFERLCGPNDDIKLLMING